MMRSRGFEDLLAVVGQNQPAPTSRARELVSCTLPSARARLW
jgi:hypothetical protein